MSVAGRLFTGAYTALFTAAALGLGYGTGCAIAETFKEAASKYGTTGEAILGTAGCIAVAGLTMLATAGALWMENIPFIPNMIDVFVPVLFRETEIRG